MPTVPVQEFGVAFAQALLPLLVAIGGWLGTQAAVWLRAHAHSKAADTAITVLTEIVTNVVKDVENTMASALRDKTADGTLTAADAAAVKDTALAAIKSYYGDKGIALLCSSLNLNPSFATSFIGSKIETAVYDLNAVRPLSAAPNAAVTPAVATPAAPIPTPPPAAPGVSG